MSISASLLRTAYKLSGAKKAFAFPDKEAAYREAFRVLPDGGVGLDVGCGSGALTIACAKRNPKGRMVGVDRWGKDYAEVRMIDTTNGMFMTKKEAGHLILQGSTLLVGRK